MNNVVFSYEVVTANPRYTIEVVDNQPEKPHTYYGQGRFTVALVAADGEEVINTEDFHTLHGAFKGLAKRLKEAGL